MPKIRILHFPRKLCKTRRTAIKVRARSSVVISVPKMPHCLFSTFLDISRCQAFLKFFYFVFSMLLTFSLFFLLFIHPGFVSPEHLFFAAQGQQALRKQVLSLPLYLCSTLINLFIFFIFYRNRIL
jgi:hypothetical protein